MAKFEIEIGATNEKLKKAVKESQDALNGLGGGFGSVNKKATQNSAKITENSRLYKQLSVALTEMRKNAQDVGAQFGVNSHQFDRASKSVKELDARLKGIDSALGNNQRNVGNYSSALGNLTSTVGNANSISMEFSRIIQDAPYGMQGIGNNIQQLTANYAQYSQSVKTAYAEQGKSISSFGILKGAIGGMLTPLNLLTLGVSLATTAWTLYEKWSQKANKAEKENAKALVNSKKSLDEYVATLSTAQQIQINGVKNAQQELTNLKLLYDVYKNGNNTLEQRKKAYEQLRQLAPEKFLKFESDATKILDGNYKELTKSILESAKARAGASVISEKMQRSFVNSFKIEELTLTYEQLRAEEEILKKKREAFRLNKGTSEMSGAEAQLQKQENALYKKQVELATQLKNIRTDDRKIAEQVRSITEQINTSMNNGGTLLDVGNTKGDGAKTTTKSTTNPLENLLNSAELSGLDGYDKKLEQLNQKFEKFYDQQDAKAKASANNKKALAQINKDTQTAMVAHAKMATDLQIAEQQRIDDVLQGARDRNAVAEAVNRDRELQKAKIYYENILKLVQGNQQAIKEITDLSNQEKSRINAEWDAKQAEDIEKRRQLEIGYYDEINRLASDSFTQNDKNTKKGRERINKELQDRTRKIQEFFNKLKELYKNDPFMQGILGITETQAISQATSGAESAKTPSRFDNEDFQSGLYQATQRFQMDFIGALQNISNQGKGLILGLGDSFTGMFDDVFRQQLNQAFTDLSNGAKVNIKEIGTALTSTLGNIISGLSKSTSALGQGAGGALSGGASGFMLGNSLIGTLGKSAGVWGAVIGGAIGLLGGIFGASKAKKQEELQKKQVALQEQQLAEQKRANALAYTSNIIGQMTRDGLVTAIERDAYGSLVGKIDGKDIKLAIDRVTASQKR